eukprot:TRINITY_DN4142_c0_g1_i1.p1 TRINITY_DN4142_c0_g1~~TRINITY_DN4142_c0_g1_i1.p1  ORF type:complete len:387 (-),score=48.52 TRINITY_DN4142_c0_g1_i1:72-1232(-)
MDPNAQIYTNCLPFQQHVTGEWSPEPDVELVEQHGRGGDTSANIHLRSLNVHPVIGGVVADQNGNKNSRSSHNPYLHLLEHVAAVEEGPKKLLHINAIERGLQNATSDVITTQQLMTFRLPCGPDKNTTANANGALRIFVCSCRSGNCLGGLWAFKLFSPEAGWATYQLLLHIAVVQIGPDTFRVTQTNDPRSVLVGCAVVRNQVMLRGQEEVWELSIAFERSTFVWTAAWQVHQHDSGSWRLRPTDVKAEWPVAVGPAPTLWLDTRASAFACGYRRWRCRVSGPFLCTAVTGIFCVPKLATFMAVARAHRDMFPVVRRDGCGLILRITALACRPLLTEEDAATILEALGVAAHTKQHEEGTPVQLLCAKVTALRDFIQAGDAHQA